MPRKLGTGVPKSNGIIDWLLVAAMDWQSQTVLGPEGEGAGSTVSPVRL